MRNWKKCTISDLGEVVGGATPSTKRPENYENGDIPWITPKDLSTFNKRFILRGERNITEIGLNSCSTRLLPPNTVLFSSRAPVGYVAIAAKAVCTNQGFKSIIPNTNTDYMFLYYLLKYNKENIENMSSGTTFKEVSGNTMKTIKVCVPVDIEDQRKIASILSALDDKIELNQRINSNLEQQAQALFLEYYALSTITGRFTDIISISGGGTPRTDNATFWNGDVPFFTPKDVGKPYTLETEKYISQIGLEHCNSKLYPMNTVFVTARGTVGKVGLAGVPMAMNQSCYALVGDNIPSLLVYFYALIAVQGLQHKASGAVFDAITTRDFETETISFLDDKSSSSFMKIAKPMYQQILNNSIENQKLVILRDTLLPRLMSGELDVSKIDI